MNSSATDIEMRLREAAMRDAAHDDEDALRAAERLSERAAAAGAADVAYAQLDSEVGPLLVALTDRGLVRVSFIRGEHDLQDVLDELAARVSPRIVRASGRTDGVRRELDEYLDGRRRDFDVPLDRRLMNPFQLRVLRATAAIPYGSVRTYSEMAVAAGSPRASRAAGNALARNPIPIVVPCHRVLRTSGALGGYGGGIDRKEWLLALESAGSATPGR